MILREAYDATGGDVGTHRLLEADEMLPDVAQLEALRDVRLLLGRHCLGFVASQSESYFGFPDRRVQKSQKSPCLL